MRARTHKWTVLLAVVLATLAVPTSASASHHPRAGHYKAISSAGSTFEFSVEQATCAPPVRGGAQHQKKGFCFIPITQPSFDNTCPSGFVYHGEQYALFEELLSAAGKLSEPEISSDETTGSFHITVDRHGHASGYFEILELHYPEEGGTTPEKCPSARITFTAKRA